MSTNEQPQSLLCSIDKISCRLIDVVYSALPKHADYLQYQDAVEFTFNPVSLQS
jgi:hypothetical protein